MSYSALPPRLDQGSNSNNACRMTQCRSLSQLALPGSPTILSCGFSVISWLGNGDWGREKETPEASGTHSKGIGESGGGERKVEASQCPLWVRRTGGFPIPECKVTTIP